MTDTPPPVIEEPAPRPQAVEPQQRHQLTPLQEVVAHVGKFTEQDARLIRATCCADANLSLEELARFLLVCKARNLDPLQNQIYAIRRKTNDGKSKVTHQTGIDGYRTIASRSGAHLSTSEPLFVEGDGQGGILSCSVTVCKLTQGQIGTFTGVAFMSEYFPTKNNWMWRARPRGQLAKCAEALALRQAFPEDLGGIYTATEMEQDGGELEHVDSRVVRPEPEPVVAEAMPQGDAAQWKTDPGGVS